MYPHFRFRRAWRRRAVPAGPGSHTMGRRSRFRKALLLAIPILLIWVYGQERTRVRAQENPEPVTPGRQEVSAQIDDTHALALTTVRQELINGSLREHAGSCTLPISDEAAILSFQVTEPPPRPKEADKPRGRVEAVGRNLYRVAVDRVPARGRARVEVTYAETLARRGDRRKYIFPVLPPGAHEAVTGMSARVRIEARQAPQRVGSSTHPMRIHRPASHVALLTYETKRPPDGRDLVVEYTLPPAPADARVRLSVFTPADPGDDPYFLLALPSPAALLQGRRGAEKPADVVFCLDVSGSTAGRKINAILEAACDGLSDLSPRDRFGVVAFDDDVRTFRRKLVEATPTAVTKAIRFVNRTRAGGGSDPGRALRAALDLLGTQPARGRTAVIAVVVDGEDPAGLAEEAAALRLARRGIRLAALGALPDTRLLHYRLAGRSLRSGPAVALSRAALTHGPALSAARLEGGPLNASYIYPPPERLPDLPLSTPVLFVGRLNEAPPPRGTLALAGKLEGKERSLTVPYAWEPLGPGSPVPGLWANRRIRRLQQLAGRSPDSSGELLGTAEDIRKEHALAAEPLQ